MKSLAYEIVDVFTDRPFTGNPLAVVYDAEELSTGQMQALAREFNLSETIFVLPAEAPGATYRVRIFTPGAEMPFAGHPSVGAAVTLLRAGRIGAGRVVQECGAGLLPVEVSESGTATLTGGTPHIGDALDAPALLAMVGLTEADLARPSRPGAPDLAGPSGPGAADPAPRVAGCGLNFGYLPVRPEAVAKARPVGGAPPAPQVSVFSWDADTATAHARVFCPDLAVPEDPATGSAALGLGVWLVDAGLLPPDGYATYTVRQGAELHRPSTLECAVTAVAGAALSVTVSGHVVAVAEGRIAIPPFIG